MDDVKHRQLAETLALWGRLGSSFASPRSKGSIPPKPGERGFAIVREDGILARWAAFASDLLRSQRAMSWQPARCMVEAMRAWTAVRKNACQALLEKSDARLAPFGEPLRVDFGAHGWLRNEREESYTAWLGWIVEQLKEPDTIFNLFGIEDEAAANVARGAAFKGADREVWILENTRRLDLVVRYEGVVLIVVEVKVTGADSAETAKQKEYFDWMEKQSERFQRAVLLATNASKEEYEKFHFVSWEHVCVELRRFAGRYSSTRPIVTAMILAFVSAVERNLLGMSLPESDAPAISWMAQSAVFEHIEESLKGERQ